MSVSWAELRQAIKEVIKEEQEAEENKPSVSEITKAHACSCPDCFCDIIKTMNKTSDYMCADCHLPLGDEEFVKKIPACPNCGSTVPKRIER